MIGSSGFATNPIILPCRRTAAPPDVAFISYWWCVMEMIDASGTDNGLENTSCLQFPLPAVSQNRIRTG